MNSVEQNLANWRWSLLSSIPVGGLLSRNPVAYKWKAPFRMGYSKIDHDGYETHFANRWMELYGDRHIRSMELCMETFHLEYNELWPVLMEKLEAWIEANDAELEATKDDPSAPA